MQLLAANGIAMRFDKIKVGKIIICRTRADQPSVYPYHAAGAENETRRRERGGQ